MFPVKENILQTVALLKAYQIKQIVLSPGSRNAPIVQAFTQDRFFHCHSMVDERNAAFYALGIIQCTQQPVAVCCTSGTALLNYAPAVAEAFYQQLPLVVISADRATEWIGQMDGQTLPQPNVFGSMVKKSVHLSEIKTATEKWYCNRLVNEALIACIANHAPVHINIPLSEPLFDYSVEKLPEVRKINYALPKKTVGIEPFAEEWNVAAKKMIVVGQMFSNPRLMELLEKLAQKSGCIILSEHLANCNSEKFIHNFDVVLAVLDKNEEANFSPDLLLTFGGHIVSKRLKRCLQAHQPKKHWQLSQSDTVVDLFQSLTDLIETDTEDFLERLINHSFQKTESNYAQSWQNLSKQIAEPAENADFSDIYATGKFLKQLPNHTQLILANSSAVRNAQLFRLHKTIEVRCNRGTSGIEGSMASAVGFASICKQPVYLLIGDLSFFYTMNALWNIQHIKNLHILLINNGGGSIFHTLPGLNKSASLNYVAAAHQTTAKLWAEAADLRYLQADNPLTLEKNLAVFMNEKTEQSVLMEVLVDIQVCKSALENYYVQQK